MRHQRVLLVGLSAVAVVSMTGAVAEAHKPITSKYTYNEHVYPIVRERCGSCHRPAGIGPMSLLTYEDAYPWGQAIKEEVVQLKMPPWRAEEGFGNLRTAHALTPHEIDILVEWCNGGTPEGKTELPETAAGVPTEGWELGEPDLSVAMPSDYPLAEDVSDATRFFVLAADFAEDMWVRAVDLRPGSSSIVRTAAVFVDTSGQARRLDAEDEAPGFSAAGDAGFAPESILALWLPGQQPMRLDRGAAYRLPAGADLVLRIHYKKNWNDEGSAMTDRTSVGLYLAEGPPAEPVQAVVVSSPGGESPGGEITLAHTVEEDIDVLALLPRVGTPAAHLQVEAVRPDGSRETMLLLSQPSPDWESQYWLASPLSLPRGSRVEVRATLADPDTEPAPTDDADAVASPIRIRLDYVPRRRAARANVDAR